MSRGEGRGARERAELLAPRPSLPRPSPDMFTPHKKPSRVDQWNGPRRSSRSEEPLLTQLNRRGVLLRLGLRPGHGARRHAVGLLLGNASAASRRRNHRRTKCGPRLLRRDRSGQDRSDPQRGGRQDSSRTERTEERCEEVREAVPPIVDHYAQGSLLVQQGQPITEKHRELLESRIGRV